MNKHLQLGKLELKSAPCKGFLYFAIFIFTLFTAICGLIYFGVIVYVSDSKLSLNDDISILYKAMAVIMLLGIVILVSSILLSKGATFYLYEKGIVADNKRMAKITLYADIQDVYLFTTGKRIFGANNVAYRKKESANWQVISARYNNYSKAIRLIRKRQEEANVPKILKQLDQGKSVTFFYVKYTKRITKQIFAINTKSYLNVTPKAIILYKDKLVAGNETVYLADVYRFSINEWTNQIQFLNKQNKILLAISSYSVFSGDSFVAILDELINKY